MDQTLRLPFSKVTSSGEKIRQ